MTIQVDPVRRNLKFGLPAGKALSWNPGGLHISQFYNTLSIFFPAGERFFIQSVRNYRQEITDAHLKEQVSAFIGQEGFHTREHEEYNEALVAAGMPIEAMDAVVVRLLELVKKAPLDEVFSYLTQETRAECAALVYAHSADLRKSHDLTVRSSPPVTTW